MGFVLSRIGLLMLVRLISTVVGETCRSDKDCDTCGVCVDKNSSLTECFYPYPRVEIVDGNFQYKRDMCADHLCANGGECWVEFGFSAPACRCDYRQFFTGIHCEIQWDKANADHYVSGFAVLFDLFRTKSKSLQVYSLDIFAVTFMTTRYVEFYLETSEGFAIMFNSSKDCIASIGRKQIYPYYPSCADPSILPTCVNVYQAKVQFPYKLGSEPGMITRSGNVIGYMANITLVAKTLNFRKYQEIYRNTHSMMINYEDLQPDQRLYIPTIELQNCGKIVEERIFYHRRSTIILNAKVKDKPRDSIQSIWTIWELGKFRNYYSNPDVFQIDKGYSLTLNPYTLQTGIYRIELKVNVIFGQKSVANYAECYIEVIKSKAVAIISGGWTKTINNKDQIIISGEKSYSPDERRTNRNLKFLWTCSPKCDRFFHKGNETHDKLVILKDVMQYNETYNFTLRVSAHGLDDGWAYQAVYVSNEEMSIYCLMNCLKEVVPTDPLLVEVKLQGNEQLQHTFIWTVTTDETGSKVDADNVTCKNNIFPSYLLCVEPFSLHYGQTYYFHAKKAGSTSVAALKVWVGEYPTFSCFITPKKGEQATTSFQISCSNPGGHSSWIFEFFDKYDTDLDRKFSGRMIGTNNLGVLKDFKLFRGNIVVYLFDVSGVASQWNQTIVLSVHNATSEEIESALAEIEYMIKKNKMELALKKVSLVSELISRRADKAYVAERLVSLIRKVNFGSQGILKLGLMTVKNFIISLTKDGDYKIKQDTLNSLTEVIKKLTSWTEFAMDLSDIAIPSISNRMLDQMATASVEAIEVALANRNETFLSTNLEHLNPSEYEDALQSSIQVDYSLSCIGRVLSFRQGTGYVKKTISASSENLSLITAQSDYLKLLANKINKNKEFPLKMSDQFIKGLNYVKELTVHLTKIRYNPFWTGRRDISTSLLSVDLYNKYSLDSKMTRIGYINNEIDLFLEVLHSQVGSVIVTVKQLDPTSVDMEDIDIRLTVLRLDLVRRSKLVLTFSFQDSNDSIKIYYSEKKRPAYTLVNSSGTIMYSGKASYENFIGGDVSHKFVYIGILPGPHVPVNGSVNVTVHFHYRLCLTWFQHKWVSRYCSVGSTTETSTIHCSCTHLSFFSAVFAVPPNEIDPFNDISLFLTLKDNWFVVGFMACILLIFFVLGVWAKFEDVKDKTRRTVLILEDNFPGDKNYYLLAVFTGCRVNAGTNANVGVRIDGSDSSSHSHILKSSRRKVLTRNSEDWFMIQTPQPLGVIKQIHVWHDNTGSSPDWYCYKMVVYDLQTIFLYTFFVEQWLALESGEFSEAVIFPATSEDMNNIKRIFFENIVFGFRDADMSGSILARHPRSRIDRLDKVAILMCFVMITLLVSLAFYKFPSDDDSVGYDNFGFTFESEDILISFQTFVISSVFILFVTVCFAKAHKPRQEHKGRGNASFLYTRTLKKDHYTKTEAMEKTATSSSRSIGKHSFYHRMARKMRMTFHPLPLSPVALTMSSSQVKRNRLLYFIAWLVSILLVIFCLFFIILYGLKLGQEESKKWLASITLVLVQEFLIMSPLKIVVIGLILATTFERFVQISNYNITGEDFLKETEAKSHLYYSTLMKNRAQPMYKPISVIQSDKLRKEFRVRKILGSQLDLIIVIAYIVIICLVTYDYAILVQLNANYHVSQMINVKYMSKQVSFKYIHNRTLFYDYLDNTLVSTLFTNKWYNHENLNPPGVQVQWKWWTMDKVTKLVGSPTCRQIRVDPKKCSLNHVVENVSVECIPNWSSDVEDNDNYDYGWKIATAYENLHKGDSAWRHVLPSQSDRLSRQGESWTSYHGGGYMVSLSSDMFETKDTLQILTEGKWVNEFTRVIFLDFTLFNVNRNMFTEVVLIAEHFPFGLYVTRTMIDSVRLDMIHSVWKAGFILFVFIILFHVVKMLRQMNRKGFYKYISEIENTYQLFITGLGVLSIIFFVVHIKTSLDYTETFQRRGSDVFFEFDKIVYYSTISANSLTILFCCLSFRVFSLWPFGGRSLSIYHTLLYSGKSIARLQIILFVYIFMFSRLISYLSNHIITYSAFFWLWSKSVFKCLNIADLVVVFLLSYSIKLCLVFILMLFRYHYRLEKEKKEKPSDFEVLYKWITRHR